MTRQAQAIAATAGTVLHRDVFCIARPASMRPELACKHGTLTVRILIPQAYGAYQANALSLPLVKTPIKFQLRRKQIQFCAQWLNRLGRIKLAASLIRGLKKFSPARQILHGMLGYRRPFSSLQEAADSIVPFHSAGHASRENANLHLALADKPRPSDYAALFHLRSVLPEIRSVFDLGGNTGNLFYCYSNYLELPTTLTWIVYDLPGMLAIGKELARHRNEHRLRFTESLLDADGADLLIASGSLHYFERPPSAWIADLERKPKYVLINRTPLTDGRTVAAVQDSGPLLVACNLFNRDVLLQGFQALGYEPVDSWRAEELSVQMPCYPELSVPAYSGMFLELRSLIHPLTDKPERRLAGLSVVK